MIAVNGSQTILAILVVVSLLLGAMAFAAATGRLSFLWRGRERELPLDRRVQVVAEQHARAIQKLESGVRQLARGQRQLSQLVESSVRHVGVVRFDAFEDMGGRLSFSAALLDGRGDGVVVTSINGRQDTRCYAKPVRGWTSIHNLSDEEREAIREARGQGAARQVAEAR